MLKRKKVFGSFLLLLNFNAAKRKTTKQKQTNKQKTTTYLHSKLVNKSVTVYRPEEKALLLQKILKKNN